jgi:hypothetical protein
VRRGGVFTSTERMESEVDALYLAAGSIDIILRIILHHEGEESMSCKVRTLVSCHLQKVRSTHARSCWNVETRNSKVRIEAHSAARFSR